jgi:DNA recombination protein RmuC
MKIAEDTGRLYDKLVGFVTDLENIGINLDRAAVAYEAAYKKFSTGRGNILSKVENIRELGVKTAKKLQAGEE